MGQKEPGWIRTLVAVPYASAGLLVATVAAAAQESQAEASGPPWWLGGGLVALLAGATALVGWFVWRDWKAARASRAWPTASGTILSGELTTQAERDSEEGTTVHYVPRVRYVYEVDGRRYESDRIRFGNIKESEKKARAILDRYAPDSAVQVYYDPADPNRATLETKASLGIAFFGLITLALMLVFMIYMFWG